MLVGYGALFFVPMIDDSNHPTTPNPLLEKRRGLLLEYWWRMGF
jgi:hypothetical protein